MLDGNPLLAFLSIMLCLFYFFNCWKMVDLQACSAPLGGALQACRSAIFEKWWKCGSNLGIYIRSEQTLFFEGFSAFIGSLKVDWGNGGKGHRGQESNPRHAHRQAGLAAYRCPEGWAKPSGEERTFLTQIFVSGEVPGTKIMLWWEFVAKYR